MDALNGGVRAEQVGLAGAGAAPRTSTPATAPSAGASTTVVPDSAALDLGVADAEAGTSVRALCGPVAHAFIMGPRATSPRAGRSRGDVLESGKRRTESRDSPCPEPRLTDRLAVPGNRDSPCPGTATACPEPRLAASVRAGWGENGVPWDGHRSRRRRAGRGGCRTGRRTGRSRLAPQLGQPAAGALGRSGAAATPGTARTPAAAACIHPSDRSRAADGRRAASRRSPAGRPVARAATQRVQQPTVRPSRRQASPLRTPTALDEVSRDVLRRLEEPLVVGAAADGAAVPLREQPDLLHLRAHLPAQEPAAQRGDPPTEAGDRVPERRPVAVFPSLAAELELVALVGADVGVVAREGDQCTHVRILTHPDDIRRAAARLQLGARW